ncbi:MAG: hypothetical protein ACM3X3_06385 [Betaproteobacteria bacterium]
MFSAISKFLVDLLAVALAGAAIKLMDDHLDYEADIAQGRPSLLHVMGRGAVLYSLVFALISCGINLRLGAPLVLAAYPVGMLKNPNQMLPLGLPAWMESALVAAATLLLFGWKATCVSVLLMAAVQIGDDLQDLASDRALGRANLARRLGRGESILLCLVALLAAMILDRRTTILVCLCTPVIEAASRIAGHGEVGGGETRVD